MSAVVSENLIEKDNLNKNDIRPFTGQEFLSSLDDGREIWLRGEKIENVVDHPAFRNSARNLCAIVAVSIDLRPQIGYSFFQKKMRCIEIILIV